jgi:Protein of unknown function (DUF4197)
MLLAHMKALAILLLSLVLCSASQAASLFDVLGLGKKDTNQSPGSPVLNTALSQDELINGLKEALAKGVQHAVSSLGHDGGFLTNLNVRIPMPEKLRTIEKTLRTFRQDQLADEFVTTMNHAAEQAVPAAAAIFAEAVQGMTIQDGRAILLGATNAATEYFRKATGQKLYDSFLPIVKKATDATGVTAAYKKIMEKVSTTTSFGSFGKTLLGAEAMDVDAYVTNKAMDGLFKMISDEEKRIRENPVARTTDLLQKVFGAVVK